jgi:tripartite-type tricarboxylate transporter receptor subunit TctC
MYAKGYPMLKRSTPARAPVPRRLAARVIAYSVGYTALHGAALFTSAIGLSCQVNAQTRMPYPSKPVRIVTPFPPGGYADLMARMVAAELSAKYGQAVTVDNRPGAGGSIGAEVVARAPADGLTLLMGSIGSNAINKHLQKNLSFDPIKSFDPIMFVADAETVLVVPATLDIQNLADLVRLAKAKPGRMSYASAGTGSTSHLAGELFENKAGVHLIHIAYRGNSPALNDLIAGQVQLSFATLQTALPFIQAGKLKALAVLGTQRNQALPQVPTLAEAGLKGLEVRNWVGLFAPASTPAAIIQQLYGDVASFMRQSATQERLAKLALRYIDMPPREFSSFVTQESERWGQIIRSAGITAD